MFVRSRGVMSDGQLKSTHKASDQRFKFSAQGGLPLRKALFLAPASRLLFVLFAKLKIPSSRAYTTLTPDLKSLGTNH